MAGIRAPALLFVTFFVLFAIVQKSHCSKKAAGIARKEDVPFIKCQVCEILATQLHGQILNKRAGIAPKKLSEFEIIEILENVCNLKKEEADWILKIDIQEKVDELRLVEQDSEGQCKSKCKTIERACQEVLGYSDTDVAEFMYISNPSLDSLVKYLCKDLTKVCSRKPPSLPKGRQPGEPFIPRPSKEAEMNKMLRSMEDMPGAPGMKMYSREELMSMKNFGEEDEEEDDDDGDNSHFASNLGRILKDKEEDGGGAGRGWRRKVESAVTGLRSGAHQAVKGLRQWWMGGKNKDPKPEL